MMKKWIFLGLLPVLAAGATLAILDQTGTVDVAESLQSARRQINEIAHSVSDDKAQAATAANEKPTTILAPAVSVAIAKPGRFVEQVMVIGSLTAREEILIAPEVDGLRVVSLAVDEGDTVRKGQVLATLERETLMAQMAQNDANLARADAAIAQAKSRIAEAQAVVSEAEAQLARAKPLKARRILSASVYDQRKAAAQTARAQLATARDGVGVATADKAQIEAQRRELEWRLSKTKIKAQTDGLITRRTARIGDLGSIAKAPLFRLAENGEIELQATVTESKLALISPGQKADVVVAGAGTIEGTVRLVSPEIDPATRLGNVRIFLGTNPKLRIGAFGRAAIIANRSSGLSVPLAAVLFDGDKAYVQKVADGKIVSSPVVLGLTSKNQIEIVSGLANGDTVVAKAGTFLRNGDRVRPVLKDQHASRRNPTGLVQ
ncbi:MAG: efflux RND transporter periplasmic adaptor subunit [Alphaproteobacteria bacterium]|nr:efflux RND transporter periplasmic adaptor subunit [Alphaproteobacteria bacterium]